MPGIARRLGQPIRSRTIRRSSAWERPVGSGALVTSCVSRSGWEDVGWVGRPQGASSEDWVCMCIAGSAAEMAAAPYSLLRMVVNTCSVDGGEAPAALRNMPVDPALVEAMDGIASAKDGRAPQHPTIAGAVSGQLQVPGRHLALLAALDVMGDPVALARRDDAGAFHIGDMDKAVAGAVVRLGEAKARGGVELLDGAVGHGRIPIELAVPPRETARRIKRL